MPTADLLEHASGTEGCGCGTASSTFSGTEGCGCGTASSTAILADLPEHGGGTEDEKIT